MKGTLVDKQRQLKEDEEANYFAMCLLMPESQVRETAREHPEIDIVDGGSGLNALADKFLVSEQMMLIRLMQLGMIGGIGIKP